MRLVESHVEAVRPHVERGVEAVRPHFERGVEAVRPHLERAGSHVGRLVWGEPRDEL
jgi:hypothetical protein